MKWFAHCDITRSEAEVPSANDTVALVQRRTVAEVVREMIEESLTRWAESVGNSEPKTILEKLETLERNVEKAADAAAEARYFARLSTMYGIDVAHYVAQKVEIGMMPTPPDKVEREKLLAMYERKCGEFRRDYLK